MQAMIAGQHLRLEPVLDEAGLPIMLKANAESDRDIGQVFKAQVDGEERVYERKLATDPATGETAADDHGNVRFDFFELYKRRNGHLFSFPVAQNPAEQSVGRYMKSGNSAEKDIYIKKGMSFAKAADVVAQRAKAKTNEDKAKRTADLKDPDKRDENLAKTLALAIKEAQSAVVKRGGTLAEALAEDGGAKGRK